MQRDAVGDRLLLKQSWCTPCGLYMYCGSPCFLVVFQPEHELLYDVHVYAIQQCSFYIDLEESLSL